MADERFEFDSLQDSETIREFLNSLVQGFEAGRIVLSTDGKEMELNPCGLLNFTVKAKKKDGHNKLSIKVSWKEKVASDDQATSKLSISS